MEVFGIDPVRELPDSLHIRDLEESVVLHTIRDFLFLQFMGKEVMAIHIKLQAEGSPGSTVPVPCQ